MDVSVEDLFRQADILSSRATVLFAERDTLRQQAIQARAHLDYQRTQLQSEIDQLKTEADAISQNTQNPTTSR